jgi:hypothetical protein
MEERMENDRHEMMLRGKVKGVVAVNDDISLLVLEVSWDCHLLDREEIRDSLTAQIETLKAAGVPDEVRQKLYNTIEEKLIHHKETRPVEFPLPPDVARQYANLVGREVELPFAPRAVDIENFDKTQKAQRTTPVGASRH